MIGVSRGVSLSSSTAHLPTLASPLLSGADGGCSSPPRVVVTGGTWGLKLALAEHPAHVSSLSLSSSGAHGGAARVTLAAVSSSSCRGHGAQVLCLTLVEGPPYHHTVVVIEGAWRLRLALPLPSAAPSSLCLVA